MRNLVSILMKKGRNFALGASLVGALAACGENPVTREMCVSNNFKDVENAELITCEKKNQAPTLEIGVGFGDGLTGKVNYLLTAKDPEGKPIEYVLARFNGTGQIETHLNGSAVEKDIIPGTNSVSAYADDNKRARGYAEKSFASPTEEEAEAVGDIVLNSKGYAVGSTSLKNVQVTTGSSVPISCQGTFEVDYSIDSNSILEYISSTDDLNQKLSDKQKLDCAGVPNLYMRGIPESEIESRLNAWIDNGFQ